MGNIYTRLALATAMVLLATGCAQRAPYLESQMGQSLSMLKAQQTVNPQASNNTDPVAGMDAKSASPPAPFPARAAGGAPPRAGGGAANARISCRSAWSG